MKCGLAGLDKTTFFLLILILAIAAFLLFKNLGNRYLWEDECAQAILSRSLLKLGQPLAWDGRNLMDCWNGMGFNDRFVWTLHPRLPTLLIASSFACFGENAWSGRLPFAIAGWLAILFLFAWVMEMTKDKEISIISSLIMTCSIPFVLFSRQCHYYSLPIFFSIPIYYSYFFLNRRNFFIFAIFSIFLFHANYFSLAVLHLGLLCHFLLFDFSIKKLKRLMAAYLIIGLLTLPWLIQAGIIKSAFAYSIGGKWSLYALFSNILQYLIKINNYFFSLLFIPLALVLLYRKRDRFNNIFVYLLSIMICGVILFPSFAPFPIRHSTALIPVFSVFSALLIHKIKRRYRGMGYLVLIIYITTNLFSEIAGLSAKAMIKILPEKFIVRNAILSTIRHNPWKKDLIDVFNNKPLVPLIKEVTTDYDGPEEGVVKFLKEHAKEGEHVLSAYDQNTLIFYTGLRVCYVVFDKEVFDRYHNPALKDTLPAYVFSYDNVDWYIPRKDWNLGGSLDKEFFLNYFKGKGLKYKKYVLDYPDIPWGNRPEMEYHYFVTPLSVDKIEIYRIFK